MKALIFNLSFFLGIHAKINLYGQKVEGKIIYPKTFPEYTPAGSCLHVSILEVSLQDRLAPQLAQRTYNTISKHSTKKYTLHFPNNDFPDSSKFSIGAVLNIGHCSSSKNPTIGPDDYIPDTQNDVTLESIEAARNNKVEGPEVYLKKADFIQSNKNLCPTPCPQSCPDAGCPTNCCVPADQTDYQLASQQICPTNCPTVAVPPQPAPCPVCLTPPCPTCSTQSPCPTCTTLLCPTVNCMPQCPPSCLTQCIPSCPTKCCPRNTVTGK